MLEALSETWRTYAFLLVTFIFVIYVFKFTNGFKTKKQFYYTLMGTIAVTTLIEIGVILFK